MKLKKSHFWYNKSQRNGIFYFILLIVGVEIAYYTFHFSGSSTPSNSEDSVALFQVRLDSLKDAQRTFNRQIKPFNPSFLSDYKGYLLGLNTEEIDRVIAFRKTGAYIQSAKQFQTVSKVSDSTLARIQPYFAFPDWLQAKKEKRVNKKSNPRATTSKYSKIASVKPSIAKKALNAATIQDFENIGVKKYMAERIVKYRNLCKGFAFEDQLLSVYGINDWQYKKIIEYYAIISPPEVTKININTATFKEILKVPYIDFELTKKICRFRDSVKNIGSIEEIKNIEDFPIAKFKRIALYLGT